MLIPHQQVIHEVALLKRLSPEAIIGPRRKRKLVWARIEISRRLEAIGYKTARIARVLHRDPSTISFYLGRKINRKPSLLRWRTPVIRDFASWNRHTVMPYAGKPNR